MSVYKGINYVISINTGLVLPRSRVSPFSRNIVALRENWTVRGSSGGPGATGASCPKRVAGHLALDAPGLVRAPAGGLRFFENLVQDATFSVRQPGPERRCQDGRSGGYLDAAEFGDGMTFARTSRRCWRTWGAARPVNIARQGFRLVPSEKSTAPAIRSTGLPSGPRSSEAARRAGS